MNISKFKMGDYVIHNSHPTLFGEIVQITSKHVTLQKHAKGGIIILKIKIDSSDDGWERVDELPKDNTDINETLKELGIGDFPLQQNEDEENFDLGNEDMEDMIERLRNHILGGNLGQGGYFQSSSFDQRAIKREPPKQLSLEEQLKKAVKEERYEDAAKLRDQINAKK